MTDAKFFSTTKKGEIYEIKNDLNSPDKDKIKDAVKKVIASMTVGKDVSSLFADVLKNMQTEDLALKKLIYLYLMNYAKSQPELAILAVNTFVKDCDDPNPLIRALAIRTMGCIRVDKIIDYLCLPLGKCLKDADPYVRKTAVIGVAKLFDLNASLCESNGFLEELANMLSDSNPMVVSNAVAALTEINEESGQNVISITPQILNQLLAALNECNEWGQIFILDSLSKYQPASTREAQSIADRVITRLNHANGAVVLSAVRILLKLAAIIDNKDYVATIYQKIGAPLVTLLSSEPEVAYVALRNIDLILRKVPFIMSQDMRVFFCKYNDPPYVKLEKLEIITRLASEKNLDSVLAELKEYASEADIDFVRRSVSAIGRIAIKLERGAERCISSLLDLIKTKVNYVVQEAIVVIKDIFRKYPNKYESLIPALAENIETLDEPEAKASMVWIIGEYGERIENSGDLLTTLAENFEEESSEVQLQLLTATVKLFLKKPAAAQALVQKVIQMATTGSDNPDLRDRGYIYWRLLSTDPAAAKAVVLAEKPPISAATEDGIQGSLLDELLDHLTSLASVYHKPPAAFLNTGGKMAPLSVKSLPQPSFTNEDEEGANGESLIADSQPDVGGAQASSGMGDLLDLDIGSDIPTSSAGKSSGGGGLMDDLLDLLGGGPAAPVASQAPAVANGAAPRVSVLTREQGQGLEITTSYARRSGQVFMDLHLTNATSQPMTDFGIQFNKNSFALTPAAPLRLNVLPPNQSADFSLPLAPSGQRQKTDPLNLIQIAVKNNVSVFYTQVRVPLHVLFSEDGRIDQQGWMQFWQENTLEQKQVIANLNPRTILSLQTRLPSANVFVVGSRQANGGESLFTSVKVAGTFVVLLEVGVAVAQNSLYVTARSNIVEIIPLVIEGLEAIVRA